MTEFVDLKPDECHYFLDSSTKKKGPHSLVCGQKALKQDYEWLRSSYCKDHVDLMLAKNKTFTPDKAYFRAKD